MIESNVLILKRLYEDYTKKYIKKILISVIFSVFVAGSTSMIAWLLDPAIKKIFIDKDQTLIYIIPAMIVFAFATKGLSLYLAKVIMISVAEEVKKDIQVDMLNSLIAADTEIINNKHTGKIISNLTFDVTMITNLVSTAILNFFKDSLTLIGLLTVMFLQNWKLSLIAMIMIPLASIAAKSLGKRMGKVTTEAQEKAGSLTSYLMEIFKNHNLIKIFQQEKYENSRAEKYIDSLKEKSKKIGVVIVRASPIMETLTGIMIAILIFYSGKLIINNDLDINNFFSFLAAMMLAYQPVRSLATLNIAINQGLSGAKRVIPVIDKKNEITDQENDKDLKISSGNIKFKDVTFKYTSSEENILKSVNLDIVGGKMTSLVGHSGAGKSTILNLIPRFYNIFDGDIIIDGQSIYQSKIYSLRKNISLVSQDTTLFDDTIKNNILYANLNATQKEMEEAAKNSFADEFINKLPDKYETMIGENGIRLSGGEKQRISIARAMLKKSPIILLDEATSSLDAETENKIQKAITVLTKNRTTVVIAHRLSTILNSDRIYVIDAGKIMGEGNHEELLLNSKIYKNFYDKQIRKADVISL
jgi:ATP-binding cassette, subfamily B, bacterial MsbA